ncbi:MAG: DUF2500 domain-containing protein [Oscillospiraceae bacterium]|nr:DUF2500 domain-containing protein [Oscillospiraceae bacterium]
MTEFHLKLAKIVLFGVLAIILALIIVIIVVSSSSVIPILTSPEQSEHVEVIGKRVSQATFHRGRSFNFYFISFKFTDSSVKEFKVGDTNNKIVYITLHEGDVGILTYKERENIEEHIKDETLRWDGRRFIGFEKDTEADNDEKDG